MEVKSAFYPLSVLSQVLLPGAQPVTVSDCVAAGDVSVVVANTRRARRLAEGLAPGYVVGFTAAGSGRDTVDFVHPSPAKITPI